MQADQCKLFNARLVFFILHCSFCILHWFINPTALIAATPTKEPGSDIKLERVPPMTPAQSLASVEVASGFRMELVAAEPSVRSPVAMSFDEAGRMYVVEMVDYSEQDKEHLGRIRLLTDEDGDGRYETSKIFVDHLSWPTAVTCYDGGIFVGEPPNIRYCKDTNGDGKADINDVVFTGFSRKNVQGMMNSLQWGLDHRIYGSSSTTGGKVTRVRNGSSDPSQPELDLHNRDFTINPKTLQMGTLTGGGQHGMSFNRWGDRFVCSNSDHLQAIVFEERYVARNPFQSVVSARRSIATDGPQAEVYRISPVEAWRVARTMLRVTKQVPGMIEGGGRAAGYFTGATGVTIYTGGLWPGKNAEEIALTADVGSNLIHRKRLTHDGVTYRGDRIDKNSEFVRARDIWFRPVQMAIGPEGGLYVLDMCREVIEHPESLPKVLKRQLDLTSGRDRGRIYRIVPADYRYTKPKSLNKATADDLVAALDDANQWRRLTALRLIYEHQDAAVADLARAKLLDCKLPEGRIALLYAIDSLGELNESDLLKALDDPHPEVRRHALRLSEPLLEKSAKVREKVVSLFSDADPVVQFQLALTLGECRHPSATQAIAYILVHHSKNRDITDAALTSIADRAGVVLALILGDNKWATSNTAEPILSAIVGQIARQRHENDLSALIQLLSTTDEKHRAAEAALLKVLSRLPADVINGNLPQFVKLRELRASASKSLVRQARRVLQQPDAPSQDRIDAVEDLALDKFDAARELLDQLLSPQEPTTMHAAVLNVCGQYDSTAVAALILSHWEQLSPTERNQAADVLLRRGSWALAFVEYLAKGGGSISTLDPAHVARLQNYPSPKVRQSARKLKGQSVAKDRQKVFQEYKDGGVLNGGDAAQGKLIFEKNCSTCHEVGGIGHQVGPNLASMVTRGTESVLFNVLAPNAEIDPRFIEYVVTTNGQVVNGVIAGDTPTAVTLRGADNKTTTILRVDIEDIHSTGKSLMPEGFEKVIDKKSMANLLAFLQQAAVAAPGAAK
jgi:putative membrane-bound dehydrogenase-like protein